MDFDVKPVIAELTNSLYVAKTNWPINEREGRHAQAKLERANAKAFEGAISLLSRKRKPVEMMKPE